MIVDDLDTICRYICRIYSSLDIFLYHLRAMTSPLLVLLLAIKIIQWACEKFTVITKLNFIVFIVTCKLLGNYVCLRDSFKSTSSLKKYLYMSSP